MGKNDYSSVHDGQLSYPSWLEVDYLLVREPYRIREDVPHAVCYGQPKGRRHELQRAQASIQVGATNTFTVINNNQVYSYSDIILFMEKVMRQTAVDASS